MGIDNSDRAGHDDDTAADAPAPAVDPTAAPPAPGARPLVDVSPALHLAGHEEEVLGTESVPDSAPVQHHETDPDDPAHTEERIRRAVAPRSIGPIE